MVYDYEYFKKQVLALTKIDLNCYKEKQMKRRIDTLIGRHNLEGYDEMLHLYEVLEKFCMRPYQILCELPGVLKESGVFVGLISNADAESTKIRMHELGLEGVFDVVVNPETFGVKKPNPLVFQKTLEALGTTADKAVMIGDRHDRDVQPARDAGLSAIHIWFGSVDKKDDILCAETQEDVLRFLEI